MEKVSRYLSKYLTKQLIECAPPRARRVTTSRDIKLLAKSAESDYSAWVMMRVPITQLLDQYAGRVTAQTADADGYLVNFEAYIGDMPTLDNLVPVSNARSAMFAKHAFSQLRT
jgi:hypothetical protein